MTDNRYRILWLDDDINSPELEPERDEFSEHDCEVIPAPNPDVFFEKLKDEENIGCIIVDLSMPTATSIDFAEAHGGTRTGIAVLRKIKEKDKPIPKVVYTIVDDDEAKEYCLNNNIIYLHKIEYCPDQFVKEIINIIDDNEKN